MEPALEELLYFFILVSGALEKASREEGKKKKNKNREWKKEEGKRKGKIFPQSWISLQQTLGIRDWISKIPHFCFSLFLIKKGKIFFLDSSSSQSFSPEFYVYLQSFFFALVYFIFGIFTRMSAKLFGVSLLIEGGNMKLKAHQNSIETAWKPEK